MTHGWMWRLVLLTVLMLGLSGLTACGEEDPTPPFALLVESFTVNGVTYTDNVPSLTLGGSQEIPLTVTLRSGVTDAEFLWIASRGTITSPIAANASWRTPSAPGGATLRLRVRATVAGAQGEQQFTVTVVIP